MNEPRVFLAGNAGLFTMGGTRTFLVGRRRPAVVDPGPDDPRHLEAVAREVAEADEGTILVTHGHPDHGGGAASLARLTGFPVAGRVPGADLPLGDGDRVAVDDGRMEAVETPGHAPGHLAFLHFPSRDLYVGDLLLGEGSTTWVGEYPGCLEDYLRSLDRVEDLQPRRIHPAHGPSLDDPMAAVARFREHRLDRVRQVTEALESLGIPAPGPGGQKGSGSGASSGSPSPHRAAGLPDEIVDRVYGQELPPGLREAARWSVRAILEYLNVLPFPPEGAPTEQGDRLAGGS